MSKLDNRADGRSALESIASRTFVAHRACPDVRCTLLTLCCVNVLVLPPASHRCQQSVFGFTYVSRSVLAAPKATTGTLRSCVLEQPASTKTFSGCPPPPPPPSPPILGTTLSDDGILSWNVAGCCCWNTVERGNLHSVLQAFVTSRCRKTIVMFCRGPHREKIVRYRPVRNKARASLRKKAIPTGARRRPSILLPGAPLSYQAGNWNPPVRKRRLH